MQGRKRKPGKLRELEGNPGHRKIPKEAKIDQSIGAAPEHLGPIGRAFWKRVVGAMPPGVYTAADRGCLELCCMQYEMLRLAKRELAGFLGATESGGRLPVREEQGEGQPAGTCLVTPNGSLQTNPLVTQINRHTLILARYLAELGLTPASRSRLSLEKQEDEEDDAFFGGAVVGDWKK